MAGDDEEDPSLFDRFDANGARVARVTCEWGFDLMREIAPVVPARPGETAFTVSVHSRAARPKMADVRVEERAVVAWRVVADRSAEPVFVEHPCYAWMTYFRTPSGRLRCEASEEEFADFDELRAHVLRDVQGRWDRERLRGASDTGRAATH